MMLSAASGFIMQSEKYSRENAGQSLKKYILLKKGELAYNHGASKYKPFGCCFELKESEAKIKSQLLVKKEGGTRYALSFSKFQTLKIDLPTKNEQDKMVSQLKCVNKTLANEEGILFNLQKLKNGLLQQMFI